MALCEAERGIDDYSDMTANEKRFMKIWNRFVHRHSIDADFQVPAACNAFARLYALRLPSLSSSLALVFVFVVFFFFFVFVFFFFSFVLSFSSSFSSSFPLSVA
ncbi:hypothetical protein T484DRAFT_1795860 [Baffinella frigidus]|nr:hypothetical protein T484DRAFT_1795860 [Cryptophyta sp. CCMP2293]